MPTPLTKRCARCDLDLSLGSFHRDRTRIDGLATACKTCRKELAAARYLRNRAEILEKCREYFQANQTACMARNAEWAAEHPEAVRGYRRKHRAKVKAAKQGAGL